MRYMRTVSFDFIDEVENTILILERVEHLLALLAEEIDEMPHEITKEEAWKALFITNRIGTLDALNTSSLEMLIQQKKALEHQISQLSVSKEKDPCITDQSTLQGSNQNTPQSGTARL